jgi:signal transduction protein with GAF and PtsI domain
MEKHTRRRIYLKEFKAISLAISTYEDFELLINHIVEGVTHAFDVKGTSILLFDERDNQLYHVASYGISERYINKGPIFVNAKYCAISTDEPVFIEDLQKDPRIQYPEAAAKEGIASMLSVPIKYRGAAIGVIRVYDSTHLGFHEEDVDSFSVLAQQLGLVIENNGLKNFLEMVKESLGNLPLRMLGRHSSAMKESRSTRS